MMSGRSTWGSASSRSGPSWDDGRFGRIQLEHPTALLLRARQPFDLDLLDLLRIQLDVFLYLQSVGLGSRMRIRIEA